MSVSCEYCVLSGRGLCVGLITSPEECYWVLCVQWVLSRSPVRGGCDPESGQSTTGISLIYIHTVFYLGIELKTQLDADIVHNFRNVY
jgi:hypothetical protein